jgi:tripartite-type tricarboxylate transporter receptor subunit TctC
LIIAAPAWRFEARSAQEQDPMIDRRALGAAFFATPSLAHRAEAQPAWPERPLRLIVPFPAGSTPDTVGRAVAAGLATRLGQPCIVENRPGAGGNLGTDQVAEATDGHTLGVTINGPLTTAPALYRTLPYAPLRDLALVSLLARGAQLLVVHPDVPATDLAGFVAHARANPGRLAFGSVGSGSGSHLAMADLAARAGLDLLHVPYRGFPQAVLDLVAGRIQALVLIAAGILPQLQVGQVRALATTGAARLAQAPGVPTLAEAGFVGAESYAWNGLIAPATMPPARQSQLAMLVRDSLTDPAIRQPLEAAGFEIIASDPEAFRRFAEAETLRWTEVIVRLAIVPEA